MSGRGPSGTRKCRRCGERHKWPAEFGVTRNGTQSTYCIHCESVYRYCKECGKRRKAPDEIFPKGRVCFDCKAVARRAWKKAYRQANREHIEAYSAAWRAAHPDRVRAYRHTAWLNIRNDPEKYERRLADARIASRLHGRVKGTQNHKADVGGYEPAPTGVHSGTQLPVDPLREWLSKRFPGWTTMDIANYIDFDDSHLYKILTGKQKVISEHIVDRILVGADSVHLFSLLYPDES